MLGVMILIVGAALIADWQAIGYDPCTHFSLFHHPELANKSKPGPICLDNYDLTNLVWWTLSSTPFSVTTLASLKER